MSYSCDDNIVLFIGNPREGDLAYDPTPVVLQSGAGIVCAYTEIWMIDLINEFCLRGNWLPTAGESRDAQQNIVERIPAGLYGTYRFVVSERAKLDEFMQQANKWHRGQKRNNSIWLYHQFVGEESMRRSLIYNIRSTDTAVSYPKDNNDMAIDLDLQIERHYCWENYEVTLTQTNPLIRVAYWGFIQDLQLEEGTENGRIQLLNIYDLIRDPLTRRIIGQVWIGIKEDVGCGLDVWSPIWECETGTDISGYAGVNVADVTASAGFYRNVNFPAVPTAITTQISMPIGQAFTGLLQRDFEQFRGDYIVLLRAKLSNQNMVVPMTIRYGWKDGGRKNVVRQSPVIFTGEADWRLIEMGVISLPPDSGRQALSLNNILRNNLSEYTIDILAGLDASGVLGDLYLDGLYLIPYEHNASLRYQGKFSPDFASAVVTDDSLLLATHEDDTNEARYLASDVLPIIAINPVADYIVNTGDFNLPTKGSRIVYAVNAFDEVAGVYKNVNELDFEIRNFYRIYPRWLTYRTENV